MMIKVKRQALFSAIAGIQTRWRLGLFIFLLIGYFSASFFPNELNVSKIQAWYPAGGLALIIGVMYGWKSWIFVFLTSLLVHIVQGDPISGIFNIAHEGLLLAALTILPYYIMRRLRVDIFLSSTKDLSYFILTSFLTSIIVSGIQLYSLNREIGYDPIELLDIRFILRTTDNDRDPIHISFCNDPDRSVGRDIYKTGKFTQDHFRSF